MKQECLSHFLVFGEAHLRHLLQQYLAHYHEARPHQGLGNVTPCGPGPPPECDIDLSAVECCSSLGGLLKSYRHKAA